MTAARRVPDAVVNAIVDLATELLSESSSPNQDDIFLRLGPYLVRLNLSDSAFVSWIAPHFAHLVEEVGRPDLTIRGVLDAERLERLETLWRQHLEVVPSTSTSFRWRQRRVQLEFDSNGLAAFETVDVGAGRAVHLGANLSRVRDIDGIRPFLVLLRWWSEATPYLIVHSAAVGNGAAGVLIGGTPGAGKSSTALAATGGSLRLVGDDIVLIGPDGIAHAIHATLRLRPDMIARFGSSAWFGKEWLDWRQKPSQVVPSASLGNLARSVRPKAIVLPRLGGGDEPRFRRVATAAAMRAMTPATVIDLYQNPARQLDKLASALAPLPCYEFSLVPDLSSIRDAFERFVGELDR